MKLTIALILLIYSTVTFSVLAFNRPAGQPLRDFILQPF